MFLVIQTETKPVGIMKKHIISNDMKVTINKTLYKTGFAKVAVQYSADTFAVNQSLVLRINICGEIRHFAKPENVSGHCKLTKFKLPLKRQENDKNRIDFYNASNIGFHW